MNRRVVSRFALMTLLAGAASMPLCAQAPPPAPPVISFAQANGAMVKASGSSLYSVAVKVSDPAGLRSVFVYGANRSLGSFYAPGTKSAAVQLYWFLHNYPAGNYTFHCTAFDVNGLRSDQAITLQLVK